MDFQVDKIEFVDTFPFFQSLFHNLSALTIDEKISLWHKKYISKFPELKEKVISEYEINGYDWEKIAKEMVFHRVEEDFSKMVKAHENILKLHFSIEKEIFDKLKVFLDIKRVLYIGLGNGAGWVDYYEGKRAILYGLEKIAELGWHSEEHLKSLISHELGHVFHFQLIQRETFPENIEKNAFNEGIWHLYSEGFAQSFSYYILGNNYDSRGEKWLLACEDKYSELKKLYLTSLGNNEKGTKDFFGDWFKVLGLGDTGYFLGWKFVEGLRKRYSFQEIALLPFEIVLNKALSYLG